MYRVSEQFITAIKNNARYIKCYFTLNDTEYNPITITIDNNIYSSDKDAFIGTFIGKSGSIKVRANDNLDLENKDIQLYFGIKLDNDTIEYVPQGTYRVYEKTSNTEYKICDHKIFFNEKINTKEVPYPTTVEKLAMWVGKKLDIDVIIPTDFPNRNLTISSEIFFGYDATYANAVEAITQATCTFAQINRSGQLEFRWFKKVDFSIDIENLPKGYPVLSKVLDPINSIVLAREPQNDNVYWPETVEDTRSEFKISNNPILDIDRYTSRMDIYDRINGFSYTPVSVGTQGFFHLDTGDIVSLQVKDEMYVDMLIMNHTLKYSGGISSQFETPALSKTMIDYSIASSIESHIYRTELEVDKVKNEIRAEIQEINTKVEKIDTTYYHAELSCSGTSITRDNSSITMSVKLLDKSDEVPTSDSVFNWKRVSSNSESDTAWNNAHKGKKSITITSSDLEASANFYCEVSAPEWQGSTSAVTVVDEVKSQVPVGMLTPNLPTTQTLDENGKVTPVWGLTLIPSMTFGIFSPDIAEITTVWKRRINNDPLTDLTAKEVVKDNVLTVTGDILTESVRSVTYYCYMQYEYSTCMAEKTFTLVKDGSSGSNGISIVSTATMYAVNNSSTEAPTTGWITSRPERSAGQYLWRKLRITYSDGTHTETEAECVTGDKGDKGDRGEQGLRGLQGVKGEQGIPGVKGTDGKTSYTHIAYSNSADGRTDFSVSDSNREYVGMYVDFVATDSTDYTKYAWSKIKGADGAQGTPGKAGADGKTPYLHIAYANNATGTSGFSTTDSTNKLYIGQYTDYISADSTEPSKYSWTKIKGETGPQGIQGIPGVRGADGISSYFHIRYSQNANGNPMSESAENAIYIGTCSTTSSTAPTGYASYKWSKIKGETGQKGDTGTPGAKGADGKTSYLHIKYSNDGTSFTSNNGETPGKYIGTYVDFTEADSTTFSKYTWVKVEGPQGVQGPKGADGRQLYTWLKYADSPTTGMSDSPTGKAYIGLAYNKTTATESSNYSDYSWSLVKGPQGNQGVPGAKGADGKTYYTWIKYATSASGAGMSDDSTGKTYIGLAYNKTTATESTNASDYTWSLIKGDKGDKGDTGAMGPILSEGNCLYKDPTFVDGLNSIKVYNNSGNGNVTNARIASSDDCPTQSEYMLEIKNIGTSSPGCGGFSWQNPARANAVFIYRIIAKIPVGRSLFWASNATGNGSEGRWLTSVAGTGKFQEYLCQLTCGSTGSFSSTGFFYINGAVGTASAPVLWYVAYATCYDMTDIPLIDVQKAINDATNNATAEINRSITSTNLRVDTLDTSLQTISETVTETSKELKTTSTKVLDIEKTVEGHKTSISKISTIENQLTGKVDIVELKVYCEFTENNNSPQLRLGSSATDTQSYITDNGFRVEYKNVVKTKVDALGLIADTVILKKADFEDNHAIYKNDKKQLIIQ